MRDRGAPLCRSVRRIGTLAGLATSIVLLWVNRRELLLFVSRAGNSRVRPLVFSLTLGLWILAGIPCVPVELLIGYVFGVGAGIPVCLAGKLLGCVAAFQLGRTLCRTHVQLYAERNELVSQLNELVLAKPLKTCLLVQFAWVPIAVKNYGLSTLPVQLHVFCIALLASSLVWCPVTVFVGSGLSNMLHIFEGRNVDGGTPAKVALAVGLTTALVLVAVVGRIARRHLHLQRARALHSSDCSHGDEDVDSGTSLT